MIYEQCKCGNRTSWSSGEVYPRCRPCAKCGSVPATAPDRHPEPLPHDFSSIEQVVTDAGPATLTRCRMCHMTRTQIDERDARAAAPC